MCLGVENTNDWISITSETNGIANGSVGYAVLANTNSIQREATFFIGGAGYLVRQDGAPCTYDLSPTSRLHPAVAQTGVVTVITLEGCTWNIVI